MATIVSIVTASDLGVLTSPLRYVVAVGHGRSDGASGTIPITVGIKFGFTEGDYSRTVSVSTLSSKLSEGSQEQTNVSILFSDYIDDWKNIIYVKAFSIRSDTGTEVEGPITKLFYRIIPKNINIGSGSQLLFDSGSGHQINNVHGSVMVGDYVYGSARGLPGGIIKIAKNDYNDVSVKRIYKSDETTQIGDIEQIVKVGDYLYGQYDGGVIQYKLADDTYKLFGVETGGGSPLDTDGVNLFVTVNRYVDIYRASDFVGPFPQFNSGSAVTRIGRYDSYSQGGYIDDPHSGHTGLNKGTCHSIIADNDYFYVAYSSSAYEYTPGAGLPYCELHKVSRTTFMAAGWCYTPRATDDMAQTATHIFLGIEEQYVGRYGREWGAVGINKSTMTLLPIRKLGRADVGGEFASLSFASLIFGNYLIDQKTNQNFYILDISDVDSWSLDDEPGDHTLAIFKPNPSLGGLSAKIPNELLLDVDSQTYHSFLWDVNPAGAPSGLIKYQIPDFLFYSVPAVQTINYELSDYFNVTLKGSLINSGGQTVTSKGFKWGTSSGSLTNDVPLSAGAAFESVLSDMEIGTYYYRAYAINSQGTGYGSIQQIVVIAPPVGVSGIVKYIDSPMVGAKVIIIDTDTNTIVSGGVLTTNSDGEYLLNNLVPDKNYLICGYHKSGSVFKRIVSKIKTPIQLD